MMMYSLAQPLPATLSVRDARGAYLAENGFTMEGYDADHTPVNVWGVRFMFPNPPSRKLALRYHDLHHIMTGYGTDLTGEVEISAWELRRGIKGFSLFIQMIILFNVVTGFLHSPRAVWRAWRVSKEGGRCPNPSFRHYESLLKLTVGELRRLYGVPDAGLTGARRLSLDAPPQRL